MVVVGDPRSLQKLLRKEGKRLTKEERMSCARGPRSALLPAASLRMGARNRLLHIKGRLRQDVDKEAQPL